MGAARPEPRLDGPVRSGSPRILRRWVVRSDVAGITPVVEQVSALCRTAGFDARVCCLNIPVALTEAISNAMLRGNRGDPERQVLVRAVIDGRGLVVDVSDEGEGFDAAAHHAGPDSAGWFDREDGRGVFLMRALMSAVEYRRDGRRRHRHTVRLTLRRP